MLTRAQEKLIKSLQSKKGRETNGLCLVEGKKVIDMAGELVDFRFTEEDTFAFPSLVTTVTPQLEAAVVHIPEWSEKDLQAKEVIVVLDGVQDPGNVGTILRLCLGFKASLLLIESADVTSPKVIRSSAGAIFLVPWMKVAREDAEGFISKLERPVYRLEKRDGSQLLGQVEMEKPFVLIAGSEGSGIQLAVDAPSVHIGHAAALDSLNVANALAIALHYLA